MAKKFPPNIENLDKYPRDGAEPRLGFSNIGLVFILGCPGAWHLQMGNSNHNVRAQIAGLSVPGEFKTLDEVSKAIKNLEIRENNGVKTVWPA